MKRYNDMSDVASHVEKLIHTHGRREDIRIDYFRVDRDNISQFTTFQIEYHGILIGLEYFLIWEYPDVEGRNHLLYVVNVTGDSALTAASELMELVAQKF